MAPKKSDGVYPSQRRLHLETLADVKGCLAAALRKLEKDKVTSPNALVLIAKTKALVYGYGKLAEMIESAELEKRLERLEKLKERPLVVPEEAVQ